ncbi:protein PYRICULARIA ORYZAE RESISTANCE 21-like [Quercus lobata]|uniref:protein PYRICULARIA ORYZAE RESISTANCE 21-like n=1 Tax=Quercus lobata TaxID=97700 RepID=UPI001248D18C|nr:protein PYRICULARIA ORYZAE RESISTANCE 21-like [Quercus lobata]
MAEEKKTTFMWIKVDLQCPRCRKKIKKLLCQIPQVQDQQYKEKENLVVIKVVCCSPEKIKQKIICKGGDTILSIEIKETEKKTKPPEKEKPPEKPAEPEEKPPPKEDTEPVSKPPVEPVCVPVRPVGFGTCCTECSEGRGGGPCLYGIGRPPLTPKPVPMPVPVPVPAYPVGFETCCTECSEGRGGGPCFYGLGRPPLTPKPVPLPVPVPVPANPVGFGTCCTECYEGRDGGPCHYGQGRTPPCYDGYYYGRPICDSYGGGWYRRSCYTYVNRCDCDYFGEEPSSGCTSM